MIAPLTVHTMVNPLLSMRALQIGSFGGFRMQAHMGWARGLLPEAGIRKLVAKLAAKYDS